MLQGILVASWVCVEYINTEADSLFSLIFAAAAVISGQIHTLHNSTMGVLGGAYGNLCHQSILIAGKAIKFIEKMFL